jgi:hypothetical protein
MLLFSQGCLDFHVNGSITTIKHNISLYFPDDKNATDKTEDLLNGAHRTIIYITILTEVLLNGVHMTIIYITILTEDSWNAIQMTTIIIRLT